MTQPGTPQASFGGAAGRGLALIIFAVLIGLALLQSTVDRSSASTIVDEGTTTTTAAPEDPTSDTVDTADTTVDTVGTGEEPGVTETTAAELPSPGLVPANELTVTVVNAKTGVDGAAGRVTTQVAGLGYVTTAAANGTGDALEDSIIYFKLGSMAEANLLANDLTWPLEFVQEMPNVIPADPNFPEDPAEWPDLIIMLGRNQAPAG